MNFKSGLVISYCLSTLLILSGCQEKPEAQQSATEAKKSASISLLQAKVERIDLAKKQFCDEDGCTQYDFQTVKTNESWIDDYFLNRIRKDIPNAFDKTETKTEAKDSAKGLNQNSIYVRFVSQQYNLVTFIMQSYIYTAGAAHGMYHNEYVTFDLSTQKRLALTDILQPNAEAQVAEKLYDANVNWLTQHNITREKLQLSDNYYYGTTGIVFVYPLYELASYAEGMTELTLPYADAKKLFKAEYLPSLPEIETDTTKAKTP